MANTPTAFFRGAATTTVTTTLATVPAATTWIVTDVVVTNTGSAAYTFDLALDGVKVATTVSVAANSINNLSFKQVLTTGKIIAGGASNVAVNFHISGIAIT